MEKYNVIFEGSILPSFNAHLVQKKVQALFKMSNEQITTLFSGQKVYLKRNISLETALEYKIKLETIGMLVTISSDNKNIIEDTMTALPINNQNNTSNTAKKFSKILSEENHIDYTQGATELNRILYAPAYCSFQSSSNNKRVSRTMFLRGFWKASLLMLVPLVNIVNIFWFLRYCYFRARDLDIPKLLAIIITISCIFVIPIILLMFVPGSKGPNQNGNKTEDGSTQDIILALIIWPLVIILSSALHSQPSYY